MMGVGGDSAAAKTVHAQYTLSPDATFEWEFRLVPFSSAPDAPPSALGVSTVV